MSTKVKKKKETGAVEIRQIRGVLRPKLFLSLVSERCEHPVSESSVMQPIVDQYDMIKWCEDVFGR
ncbi:MAG TPA: hypothetical protein VN721_05910 [Flavipsychrobacter sp.]|nr:hypothetical protein [Flavipsychrobacter sp.]